MAGDWIKMSTDLRTHPKVVRISSALKADRLRVVGGLHAVWCLFDAHSEDGSLEGYTLEALDDLIGWAGFSAAMVTVGWIAQGASDLHLPRFGSHNGQSAKRRAQETERKRLAREVDELSASDADKKRSREEKRREEKKENTQPSGCVSGAGASKSQGCRLAEDWVLPMAWGAWAIDEYPHWPAETVRLIAAGFADHWHAKAGKEGRKADWEATWRNWCRSDITQRAHPPKGSDRYLPVSKQAALEARNAAVAAEFMRELNEAH